MDASKSTYSIEDNGTKFELNIAIVIDYVKKLPLVNQGMKIRFICLIQIFLKLKAKD